MPASVSSRTRAAYEASTPAPQLRARDNGWVMVITNEGPSYWEPRTGGDTLDDGGWLVACLVVAA